MGGMKKSFINKIGHVKCFIGTLFVLTQLLTLKEITTKKKNKLYLE